MQAADYSDNINSSHCNIYHAASKTQFKARQGYMLYPTFIAL